MTGRSSRWLALFALLLGLASLAAGSRDLARDERAGGHTLARHVGRTDAQLAERLRDEPRITTASTWTDRATAERIVGTVIESSKEKIARWVAQTSHPNLVLDYHGSSPVGRSLKRGKSTSRPAVNAKIVLRWSGGTWFVLTAYPT